MLDLKDGITVMGKNGESGIRGFTKKNYKFVKRNRRMYLHMEGFYEIII